MFFLYWILCQQHFSEEFGQTDKGWRGCGTLKEHSSHQQVLRYNIITIEHECGMLKKDHSSTSKKIDGGSSVCKKEHNFFLTWFSKEFVSHLVPECCWCISVCLHLLVISCFTVSAHASPLSFQTCALLCLITCHTLMSFTRVAGISYLTANNIIKIFRESREICACKGRAWKPTTESRAAHRGISVQCKTGGVEGVGVDPASSVEANCSLPLRGLEHRVINGGQLSIFSSPLTVSPKVSFTLNTARAVPLPPLAVQIKIMTDHWNARASDFHYNPHDDITWTIWEHNNKQVTPPPRQIAF